LGAIAISKTSERFETNDKDDNWLHYLSYLIFGLYQPVLFPVPLVIFFGNFSNGFVIAVPLLHKELWNHLSPKSCNNVCGGISDKPYLFNFHGMKKRDHFTLIVPYIKFQGSSGSALYEASLHHFTLRIACRINKLVS
jgi:hypothetical protein